MNAKKKVLKILSIYANATLGEGRKDGGHSTPPNHHTQNTHTHTHTHARTNEKDLIKGQSENIRPLYYT